MYTRQKKKRIRAGAISVRLFQCLGEKESREGTDRIKGSAEREGGYERKRKKGKGGGETERGEEDISLFSLSSSFLFSLFCCVLKQKGERKSPPPRLCRCFCGDLRGVYRRTETSQGDLDRRVYRGRERLDRHIETAGEQSVYKYKEEEETEKGGRARGCIER